MNICELGGKFSSDARIARTVVVSRSDPLCLRRVEKVQISRGHRASASLIDNLVDHRHRRFGEDAHRRRDDLDPVGTQLLEREISLVLPGDQYITQTALAEGDGG